MSKHTVSGGLIPEDDAVGPVCIINDLYEAHGIIADIMIDHSRHNHYMASDIAFIMAFGAWENVKPARMYSRPKVVLCLNDDQISEKLGTT